jgi:hypothetical protein
MRKCFIKSRSQRTIVTILDSTGEDGNVKTDPKICRMTVDIFGAAYSLSVANFALHQVIQLSMEELSC